MPNERESVCVAGSARDCVYECVCVRESERERERERTEGNVRAILSVPQVEVAPMLKLRRKRVGGGGGRDEE